MIEICLKVVALGKEFFENKMEIFDAFIVTTSLILDVIFFNHKDATQVFGLLIFLRLWRVLRVFHGVYQSASARSEHNLEKSTKKCDKLKEELKDEKEYAQGLEMEIGELRDLLSNQKASLPKTNVRQRPEDVSVPMNGESPRSS